MLTLLILAAARLFAVPAPADAAAGVLHDFHVSKALVDYNQQEQALQISLHLFLDDLEEALRRQGADKLHLCTSKETADAGEHLEHYLRRHFSVQLNGRKVEYNFIGKEISDDLAAVWCYLEITGVAEVGKLTVTNNLLMEVFDDQKNIVSVTRSQRQQGVMLFQKGRETESVTF